MKIKAVLFDMDGVLVDARDWHYKALNKALEHFGLSINMETHLTNYDGLPTKVKLERLTETRELPRGLHNIINELKQKFTMKYAHQHCKPTYNHRKALSKLSKNYKIGLCSNSIKSTIEALMKLSLLTEYFDLMLSCEEVVNSKPSPDIYLAAFEKLNIKPKECLILEDNENGLRAAIESGANVMRVTEPNEVTYDKIIKEIIELERE